MIPNEGEQRSHYDLPMYMYIYIHTCMYVYIEIHMYVDISADISGCPGPIPTFHCFRLRDVEIATKTGASQVWLGRGL